MEAAEKFTRAELGTCPGRHWLRGHRTEAAVSRRGGLGWAGGIRIAGGSRTARFLNRGLTGRSPGGIDVISMGPNGATIPGDFVPVTLAAENLDLIALMEASDDFAPGTGANVEG